MRNIGFDIGFFLIIITLLTTVKGPPGMYDFFNLLRRKHCRNVRSGRNLLASVILTVLCASRVTVKESNIENRPPIPIPRSQTLADSPLGS